MLFMVSLAIIINRHGIRSKCNPGSVSNISEEIIIKSVNDNGVQRAAKATLGLVNIYSKPD